jgi:hypothetical protein
MSYLAKRTLELKFLREQNKIAVNLYNYRMLRILSARILANESYN